MKKRRFLRSLLVIVAAIIVIVLFFHPIRIRKEATVIYKNIGKEAYQTEVLVTGIKSLNRFSGKLIISGDKPSDQINGSIKSSISEIKEDVYILDLPVIQSSALVPNLNYLFVIYDSHHNILIYNSMSEKAYVLVDEEGRRPLEIYKELFPLLLSAFSLN